MKQDILVGAIAAAVAAVVLTVSFTVSAQSYDASLSYAGGAIVEYGGKQYRAKWWANPGQSPAAVANVANAWETPWELLSDTGGANAAPTVSLSSPTNGATMESGRDIAIAASAQDADGTVARVEFFANGQSLGVDSQAPFAVTWRGAGIGTHTVTAVATDDNGANATSAALTLQVIAPIESGQPGDTYDITSAYAAGCVVVSGGEHFRAKWYANPGQTPAEVDSSANPWDSPWEHTAAATASCQGGGGGGGGGDNGGSGGGEDPLAKVEIPRSRLVAEEVRLTDSPLMRQVRDSIRTLDNAQVEAVTPGRAQNPENVRRVESIVGNPQFEHLFPMRAPEYTYRGFLQAFAKFPAICATYTDGRNSDAICRKTLATMIAHFAQETGGHESWREIPEWRQGLVWVREMGWTEDMRGGYNGECNPATWQGQTWPCGTFADGAFKSYFGRGAKQLSYNYNYGPFSEAMFGTVRTLLDQPELVADTWLNLASATFFFSYPQPPKPSMLHVIDGTWQPNAHDIANGLVPGFGVTTQIINGGVECGGSSENAQSLNRIAYYQAAAAYFGVPVPGNEVLGCKGMKQFDEGGAGSVPIYWELDSSWSSTNVGGKSYACKLVGYQTPYSALKPGDYGKCVVKHFPNVVVIED